MPELVGDYCFKKEKGESHFFDYSELKDEQHRKALEIAFSESEQYGFNDLMKALKRGYATIGCIYDENKLGKLKKFLENKRMMQYLPMKEKNNHLIIRNLWTLK